MNQLPTSRANHSAERSQTSGGEGEYTDPFPSFVKGIQGNFLDQADVR